MKVYLHTIRYGIEQNLEYHGLGHYYDASNAVLYIYAPVEEVKDEEGKLIDLVIGISAIVTMTAGDRMLVVRCDDTCELHKEDKEATYPMFGKLEGRLPHPLFPKTGPA